MCVLIVLMLILGAKSGHKAALELAALVLIVVGMGLGIAALFGIPRHGCKGILPQALLGLLANGLLLSIFITNFMAAGRPRNSNASAPASPSRTSAETRSFQNGRIAFEHARQYRVLTNQVPGQIHLQHPQSNVLINEHSEAFELNESLEKLAAAVKAGILEQKFVNATCGGVERIESPGRPAGVIKFGYDCPQNGRVAGELYFIVNTTNSFSVLHLYPAKNAVLAAALFKPFMNSFVQPTTAPSRTSNTP